MSWQDVLIPKSASESSSFNSFYPQNPRVGVISGGLENKKDKKDEISEQLRHQINLAEHWGDLRMIANNVDAAALDGEITVRDTEELATEMARRARRLPEVAGKASPSCE